ncbi:MAG: TatD family hydrolase [Candidatus Margulisbacteria bacterium]|nr:TatD family hydrolase [Candidatus Margulisiibacteriota bacterium]
MLIDTHAHLNFSQFADTTPLEIINRAKATGVNKIINIGSDLKASEESVALAQQFPEIYATVGLHPHDASSFTDITLAKLAKLAKPENKVIAIGEIGLDYFKYDGNRNVQKNTFRKLLGLAKELNLPVVIHDRDAHEDILGILKEIRPTKGVVHCFSGDLEFANKIFDLGFLISFTGNITFPKAQNLRDVINTVPLEKIMLETDCPFLAPVPHRGKRNEPAYVLDIAKKIAEIKNVYLEEVAKVTTNTAQDFFNL